MGAFKPVEISAVDRDLPEKDDSTDRVGGRDGDGHVPYGRVCTISAGYRVAGALTNHYLVPDASNRLAHEHGYQRRRALRLLREPRLPAPENRENDKIGIPLDALEMYEMQQLLAAVREAGV